MYDPDRMPDPVRGAVADDHLDEQIPWMNYAIWADDIGPARARALKARGVEPTTRPATALEPRLRAASI